MLKYNFYVGLNDKYTCKQEVSTEKAEMILSEILLNEFHVYGFTMINCKGVYKMENTGKIVYENTIKIEIVSDSAIPADRIVEEIKNRLNQESVMVEKSEKNVSFL